jgi:hypothetical protein
MVFMVIPFRLPEIYGPELMVAIIEMDLDARLDSCGAPLSLQINPLIDACGAHSIR